MEKHPQSRFETDFQPHQNQLIQALRERDEFLEELYQSALQVLRDKFNAGRYPLVAHAIRELMSLLPKYIDVTPTTQERMGDRVTVMINQYQRLITKNGKANPKQMDNTPKFFQHMDEFIAWNEKHRPRRSSEFFELLRQLDGSGRSQAAHIAEINAEYWSDTKDYFVGVAHYGKVVEGEFLGRLSDFEHFLLDRLAPRTYEEMSIIDSLIQSGASDDNIRSIVTEIRKRPVNYEHFFKSLSTAEWITPLRKHGFFKSPLEPVRDGNSIWFQYWPESQYLARIVAQAPDLVLKVIQTITTENVRIHEDFAEAARRMPPALAAEVAQREARWLRTQSKVYVGLPAAEGKLIDYLVESGEFTSALKLGRSLFSFHEDPDAISPRIDATEYGALLSKHILGHIRILKVAGLKILRGLLHEATRKTKHSQHSRVWRGAIASQEDGFGATDIRNTLVDGVVNTAVMLLDMGKDPDEILATISKNETVIGTRIQLHVEWEKYELLTDNAMKSVLSKALFDDRRVLPEYYRLLAKAFPDLTPEERARIIEWIESDTKSNDSKDEEVLNEIRRRRAQRLWNLRETLGPEWSDDLKAIEQEFGPNNDGSLFLPGEYWEGPTSPLGIEELRQMEVSAIADYLNRWTPTSSRRQPTREGLSRDLTKIVKEQAQRFIDDLPRLHGLDPTYTRAIVEGVNESLDQKLDINFQSLFAYINWVISQPRVTQASEATLLDHDSNWDRTRQAIGILVSNLIRRRLVDIAYRKQVWEVIETLFNEGDSELESEKVPEHPDDWLLNTIRGLAIRGVILYGLWVRKSRTKVAGRLPHFGMGSIPEVSALLLHSLDESKEHAKVMHYTIGRFLPTLLYLDNRWVKTNLDLIFPSSKPDLRESAWKGYVCENAVTRPLFTLLEKEYDEAVKRTNSDELDPNTRQTDATQRLADHIVSTVIYDIVSMSDVGCIAHRFFSKVHVSRRIKTLHSVGLWLRSEDAGHLPEPVLIRLQTFWDAFGSTTIVKGRTSEGLMEAFSSWFASGKFDARWGLHTSLQILKAGGHLKHGSSFIQQLLSYTPDHPRESLAVLRELNRGAKDFWLVVVSNDEILQILAHCREVPGIGAEVIACINELGAKNHHQFRSLLP